MVLGLLQPDSGNIHVCNEPVCFGQTRTNQYIGYLPDVPEFYNYMTPIQYLKLCGEVIGLSKAEISKRSGELLSLVGLNGVTKQIDGFSRGMKQRMGIAQALLTQPKLLICDEPTSALDPVGRKEILDILSKISGTTTVLFSTHILSDVERICDHAAFLNEGKIAVSGTLAEMKALHGHDSLLLEFLTEKDLQLFKRQKPVEPLLLHSEENSVIFKQTFTSILFTGGIAALISLLGMVEPIAKYNPFLLTSKNVDLISGEAVPAEFVIPAFISVALSIFGLLIAIRLFNKKQL